MTVPMAPACPVRAPEVEVLTRCCAPRFDAAPEIARRLDRGVDWEILGELAIWHRVATLLDCALEPVSGSPVPRTTREKLRALRAATGERHQRHRWELRKVLWALESRGIPAILLKGAALVETVYAHDPTLRPMADLDVLIHEADLDRAEAVVRSLGYASPHPPALQRAQRRHHRHYPPLVHRDGATCFELHRHVVRPGSVAAFDIEAFWRRARPLTLDGASARILSPEDQAIHLALNLFQDARQAMPSRGALGKLADLAAVLGDEAVPVDGARLVERARALGLLGPVACVLAAARELLGPNVPTARLEGPLVDRPSVEAFVRTKLLAPPGEVWALHELVEPPDRPSLGNELRSVARVLARGRRDLSLHFPSRRARRRAHLRSIGHLLDLAARDPRRLFAHRRVDHWMHRFLHQPPR